MRSPGRYTVEETRDLFNRYLLARGYTLLEVNGGLTVAKTQGINAAIVPRVTEEKLAVLPAYSFVRATLDVGWLSAEKLAVELAPMISSNGKLTALTTTNRIEAMDAAVNLRQVAELLQLERDSTSREALAPEFKLRFLPAEEAKRMLEEFLGVEKKEAKPLTPQQMQMMQQMRNQNKGAPPPEKKVEISIVANTRQNSVIIRAPVDRLAVAREFIKRIDVASDSIVSLADIESRVQVFRLASLDPEKLIEIVSEMNVLEPTTRVRTDKDNNALIVSGSAADRFIIDSLIKRLDGSGRQFEVLPLRRLDPSEVAESIAFLMGQKDEKKESSGRRSYYYGYYGRGDDDEKKETDEFRVAANNRYRQVLLWANEHEMEEVRSLLVKLGELPPPGGSNQTVRMIDASATPETLEYLKKLRLQWNRISPNPLELPDADQFKDPNQTPFGKKDAEDAGDDADENEDQEVEDQPKPKMTDDTLAMLNSSRSQYLTAMQQEAEGRETQGQDAGSNESDSAPIRSSQDFDRAFRQGQIPPTNRESNQPPPPVRIELDKSGNLVLISPDTDALDRLENLMLQLKPPKRPYEVFHIEHASAYWMRLNLEDYFKDLDEQDSSAADNFYSWYWGSGDDDEDDSPSGLGKGVKLRFVDDPDTNTLVVNGASGEQLRTIAELIELWDVPEPVNKRKTRFTKLVSVKYGKADKIAETVKEAYRDLLSSNDKAFSQGKGGQNGGQPKDQASKSRDGNGSGLESSESGRDAGGADFSFKGKLSLGIDTVGNTLLVSAEGEPLLQLVVDMIEQLDEAARPTGEIQVIQLPGGISGDSLRQALGPLGMDKAFNSRKGQPGNSKPTKSEE
jgi:type II secretory pathway component GspD/PulD (secretin)